MKYKTMTDKDCSKYVLPAGFWIVWSLFIPMGLGLADPLPQPSGHMQGIPATQDHPATGSGSLIVDQPFSSQNGSSETLRNVPQMFSGLQPQRDPFASTLLMQQQGTQHGGNPTFTSLQGTLAVPRLTLRGYVEGKGTDPVALLEVGGNRLFLVREGDTISLHQGQSSNTVLKVKKLNKLSALVEVGTLGQVIIVR